MNIDYPKIIKDIKEKNGLSADNIAFDLEIASDLVEKWERGETIPSPNMYNKLNNLYGPFKFEDGKYVGLEGSIKSNNDEYIPEQPTEMLGICSTCNRPIYDQSNYNLVSKDIWKGSMRHRHKETIKYLLCNNCNRKRIEEEKQAKINAEIRAGEESKKRLKNSIIFGLLAAIVFLIGTVVSFSKGNQTAGWIHFAAIFLSFTFVSTLVLDNTDLIEWWFELIDKSFDVFEGGIVGIIIGIICTILTTGFIMILSVFAYPVALYNNLSGKE